jgi:hypothetical protein
MARSDVLQLVQDISLSQADAVMCERYYDEAVDNLGEMEIVTSCELQEITADDATYTIPDTAVKLLGAFYGDRFLSEAFIQELQAYAGINWRDRKGAPIVYTKEDEDSENYRLFPRPVEASEPFSFINGMPLGVDFPNMAVATIVTERRDDLPEWLEMPVVFEILAREFARESDHHDVEFSKVCTMCASMFYRMVL